MQLDCEAFDHAFGCDAPGRQLHPVFAYRLSLTDGVDQLALQHVSRLSLIGCVSVLLGQFRDLLIVVFAGYDYDLLLGNFVDEAMFGNATRPVPFEVPLERLRLSESG